MADLITLEDYKTAMKITGFGDDTRLTSLIASASQLVKTYCNNTFVDFYSSNKTETFNMDYDSYSVSLEEVPLNTVVSVEERQTIQADFVTLVNNEEYYIDYETDSILRSDGGSGYKNFPRGPGAVRVVYTGGYSVCPADLKLAVIDLVTYYHKDEYKQRQTIAGATLQNSSSSSQRNNPGFPDHIKRVLDMYKNF